jgi:hypothetical protein
MNELVVADRASEWRRLKALVLDSVSSPITAASAISGWTNSPPGTPPSIDPRDSKKAA